LPQQRVLLQELVRRGLTLPASQNADWKNDPAGYLKNVLKADTWEAQDDIACAVRDCRRVVVRSCHHSGKTFLAGGLAHWFLSAFNPALVITTAPTDRQVRKQLWGEINRHYRRAGLSYTISTMEMSAGPDQRAYGFTTNEPEKFQGWHEANIFFIVDEASGVDEPIYEAIEGCLTGPNAKLLLIGNPNSPMGTFYEAFRSPLYEKFHISAVPQPGAYVVPSRLLPENWAEEHKDRGEESPFYQVRVLGNFPPQGENSLISLRWVEEAQQRWQDEDEALTGHDIEIGVDIARYGSDESVAYVRRGPWVIKAGYWRGSDTMESSGRIAALAKETGAALIKVDEIGVGAGVVDRLAEEGLPVIGVNVGEAAFANEDYFNLRTELFQGLADRFKEGDLYLIKDDLLLDQLTQLRFTYTPRGQKKLESKEDMRKRRGSAHGWQSPDRADALMLCFAVVPQPAMPAVAVGAGQDAGLVNWTS
jgi:phage terminase large subunit